MQNIIEKMSRFFWKCGTFVKSLVDGSWKTSECKKFHLIFDVEIFINFTQLAKILQKLFTHFLTLRLSRPASRQEDSCLHVSGILFLKKKSLKDIYTHFVLHFTKNKTLFANEMPFFDRTQKWWQNTYKVFKDFEKIFLS